MERIFEWITAKLNIRSVKRSRHDYIETDYIGIDNSIKITNVSGFTTTILTDYKIYICRKCKKEIRIGIADNINGIPKHYWYGCDCA